MSGTRERIPPNHRLHATTDFARVRAEGRAIRGEHCLVVVLVTPDAPRKVAFVASRKGVGGAVQRNRTRRRLREIVRRRWHTVTKEGIWMMFVAYRSILTAPHEALARDVERLLARAQGEPAPESPR
jgi:ribonuclease P protein component